MLRLLVRIIELEQARFSPEPDDSSLFSVARLQLQSRLYYLVDEGVVDAPG